MCSIHTMVTPPAWISRILSIELVDLGFRQAAHDLVGGRLGPGAEARASSSRLRSSSPSWPAATGWPFRSCPPAPGGQARSVDARRGSVEPKVTPTRTFSKTVSPSKGLGICAVRAMPTGRRLAGRTDVGDVPTLEEDLAFVGRELAGNEVEEGGLAGAVRPDDADGFARLDGEAQVVDDGDAEGLLQPVHRDRRGPWRHVDLHRSVDRDHAGAEAVQHVVQLRLHLTELEPLHSRQRRGEERSHLHPGQVPPRAGVCPGSERKVLGGVAGPGNVEAPGPATCARRGWPSRTARSPATSPEWPRRRRCDRRSAPGRIPG